MGTADGLNLHPATGLAPPMSARLDLSGHDLQACAALMEGGSKTFFAASRLLPQRVRAGAIALYAFCRVADDLVDQPGGGAQLPALRARLDRIYAGGPCEALEDHALSLLVRETSLPRPLLDALLEGFAWDAEGRRYLTIHDLHGYGARVAGTVGAMMAWVMGARAPGALARACDLGVAMQLTNIARDVGEDARNGRLYLPRAWMHEAGIDPEAWLLQPRFSTTLRRVIERLLDEADRLYARAQPGIAELPADCRGAILAASQIYGEIGRQLRREGGDSVNRRTVVSGPRKLALLATAWAQAGWVRTTPQSSAPLAATAFLVQACEAAVRSGASDEAPSLAVASFPSRPLPERVEWLLNLLERRERERLEHPALRRMRAR